MTNKIFPEQNKICIYKQNKIKIYQKIFYCKFFKKIMILCELKIILQILNNRRLEAKWMED
jgi:hypothetical protein